MTVSSILAVHGVTKYFGSLCAVDAVELQVEAGTIHALIGPNGSGKTTLLNLISGLVHCDGGRIELNGATSRKWRHTGEVVWFGRTFQRARLMPLMTCLDNVIASMRDDSD